MEKWECLSIRELQIKISANCVIWRSGGAAEMG
jgi:hypothetical protein